MSLTRHEAEEIAETAANKAINTFFRFFAVDINDVESLEKFREDLKFLAAQRKGSEEIKARLVDGMWYAMGIAAVGLLYLGWDLLKAGVSSLWPH